MPARSCPARQAYLSILLVGARFYICNGVSTIDKRASRGPGATGTSSRRSTPLNSIGLTTGELLYSKFFHRDSRPINGLSDPHWHVHCFLHNATFDPVEERWKAGQFRGVIADKGYFQEYFHTLLAQRLMESGYKLRRTDRGWHQWEMACITDREVELFSKRNELIDSLSEERGSTPEEERRIAQHERDSKTTKLFHGDAEIENWRQQMGPERWDLITPKAAQEGPQLKLPINPRELAIEAYFAKHSVARDRILIAEILK